MRVVFIALMAQVALAEGQPGGARELSLDIWDWTEPCKDIKLFETWVKDLASLGFTRVEISVPWGELEPEPGRYEVSWVAARLAVCKASGLGMRLRMNSGISGATPEWYEGDKWVNPDGAPAPGHMPSICDERFWGHFGPACTEVARLCKGEDVLFNACIGIHAELKWAGWFSYDASTVRRWRESIQRPRPEWLNKVVGHDAELPEAPPVPGLTQGVPDREPAHLAWIAFREQCWREAVEKFGESIHEGDTSARLSVPLGESYRRQSAEMSNLDYWGLSRGASQVVHSYDFYWHGGDGAWHGAAAIAAFQGITGLPVVFEFDSIKTTSELGYGHAELLAFAHRATWGEAGLKIANYSYFDKRPSAYAHLQDMAACYHKTWPAIGDKRRGRARPEVLLFISKWANYCYREETEWLHDAQFGVYKLLQDMGVSVRIICEDNLDEDLSGYCLIMQAFSPLELIPAEFREKLASLDMPSISDMPRIPGKKAGHEVKYAEGLGRIVVANEEGPVDVLDLTDLPGDWQFAMQANEARLAAFRGGEVVLGYPIGLMHIRMGGGSAHEGVMAWAMGKALENR